MEKGKKLDNSVWKKQRNLKRKGEQKGFIKQKKDQKQQIPKINPHNPQELSVAVARISLFNYSYPFLPCVIKNQK